MVYSGKVLRSLQSLRQLSQVVKKWREQHAATMNNAESTQEKWNNYSARIKTLDTCTLVASLYYFISLSLSLYSFFVVVFFSYIRGSSIRSKLETWWHCHQKTFLCFISPNSVFSYSSSCHDFVLFLFHFHFFVIITDSNKKKIYVLKLFEFVVARCSWTFGFLGRISVIINWKRWNYSVRDRSFN